MIRLYTFSNGTLQAGIFPTDGRLPPETVWIDLIEPSREEERAVEQALNIDAPTREEMQEIELSSRIYLEGDAAYMTALVLYKSETSEPDTTAITFIRTATALVTLRYAEPQAFRSYALRAPRQPAICSSPDAVMFGLFDAIVDRAADVLEKVGEDLDQLSRRVFNSRKGKIRPEREGDPETALEDVVRSLGRMEDLTSRMRDSLQSQTRIFSFLGHIMAEQKGGKDLRQKLKTLTRDAHSLGEHAGFLQSKGNFLLDATLGLINIQQTAIIKIFSVASVVFLPPTLVASIYGMNFKVIPELEWEFGYPYALVVMVLSAVLPYWYFKRRGWM